MFCTKCGSELKRGTKYCTKCGSPVKQNDEVSKEQDDELKKLEEEYQSLRKEKEQYEQKVMLLDDIQNLKEEIKAILTDAEKQEKTEGQKSDSEEGLNNSDLIQYCPECGFYVGNSAFCGHCGKKIRG